MSPLCQGCKHFKPSDDAKMNKAGFKICALIPKGPYRSVTLARCSFTPHKHTGAA